MAAAIPHTVSDPLQPAAGWAACLPVEDAARLAVLRTEPHLVGCETATEFWISSTRASGTLSEDEQSRYRDWLGLKLFQLTQQHLLIPWQQSVPVQELPAGPWRPLSEVLLPVAPLARFPAIRPRPCSLQLVRTDEIQAATLLRLPLLEWARYVRTAPQLRLSRWEFAVNGQEHVLVRGTPLPPLPGRHYRELDRLIVPCGWTWQPAVSSDIVHAVLGLAADSWALASSDDSSWEFLASDSFVPSLRQHVRRTIMERNTAVRDTTESDPAEETVA